MRRVYSLHIRDIAAPIARLGEIIDTLGGADDRLWAKDIWVAEPVEFDRPLGVGANGGHGSIRYSVEQYDPGRRIVFRFTPGTGLSGIHGFELQPLTRAEPVGANVPADPDRLQLRRSLLEINRGLPIASFVQPPYLSRPFCSAARRPCRMGLRLAAGRQRRHAR